MGLILVSLPTLTLLALTGCDPKVGDDTATGDSNVTGDTSTDSGDTGGDTAAPLHFTLVGTTTDFTTGALATITDGVLTDSVIPVSSDADVRAINGSVYVMNRSTENTVQRFDNLDFSAPAVEFSTGDGSDPVDVVECGGSVVVANLLTGSLLVVDRATGLQTGSVDLSSFADSDGSPEADALFVAPNGYLYVAMQQLENYVSADGSGTLAKIDCSTWNVAASWDIGPNPRMQPDPQNPAGMLIDGGNSFNADYSGPELDGAISTFDTTDDTLAGPFLTEAALGGNLGAITGMADGHLVTTLDDTGKWAILCINAADWTTTTLSLKNAYIGALVTDPTGTVWAAVGDGYGAGAYPTVGFTPIDPVNCTAGTPVTPALGPSGMAVVVQP